MSGLLHVSSSPHVRYSTSTKQLMIDVIIALIPLCIYGTFHFGFHALLVILVTTATAVASEYLWDKLMKKPVTVCDYSAIVTGLILALNMPPNIPVWVPAVGSVFAIIVIKQLFGGLGQNFINPALGARAFLLISFAELMTDYSVPKLGFDSMSSATPLSMMKNGTMPDLGKLIIGNTTGTIGEVSAIIVLIGAAYLLIRHTITYKIPFVYLGSFAVVIFVLSGFDFYYTTCQLFAGGLMFGAFFMANDYVTSPITPLGQTVYALFLGIMTAVVRKFGSSPECVSYVILLGNLVTPLIEKVTLPTPFGKGGHKQ